MYGVVSIRFVFVLLFLLVVRVTWVWFVHID